MFRRGEKRAGAGLFLLAAVLIFVCPADGQDSRKVPISFLPPPLETATYSLGIYDAKSGKLVRRLQEAATASAFTVGDNGLITNWDGKDDAGKAVPPGRYTARGYAVGALEVEGVDILGNDWAKDDETLRPKQVEAIALIPEDEGLAVVVYTGGVDWELLRFAGTDGHLLWRKPLAVAIGGSISDKVLPHATLEVRGENLDVVLLGQQAAYRIADGSKAQSPLPAFAAVDPEYAKTSMGKDDTSWKIEEGTLSQYSMPGELLRHLTPPADGPVPVGISASTKTDRLYVLERREGWQRVRGLSWVETKQENGKQVSTWQTFFEHNIHALDLVNPPTTVEVSLEENPLDPGKPQKLKLGASYDEKGSYLTIADGLRLRQISRRAGLKAAKLEKGKTANSLTLLQDDGTAWDEFSIEGARNIMEFDAGEFEMTTEGEKTHAEKATEPPDL